jgi:hypothetical protein
LDVLRLAAFIVKGGSPMLRSKRRKRRRRQFFRRLHVERLEVRSLLATVSWINPAGGAWELGGNWSSGAVPGVADDVVIDLPGDFTVRHNAGVRAVKSIRSEEALEILGGSLTVSAPSFLNGSVLVINAGLLVTGVGASLTSTGSVSVTSSNLVALGGGRLSLPGLTTFTHPTTASFYDVRLEANGTGSTLELPALANVSGAANLQSHVYVQSIAGGQVNLASLRQIGGGAIHVRARRRRFLASMRAAC